MKTVAVNETGHRIGETHQRAKFTDAEIALVLELHEAGFGARRIVRKFDDGKTISRTQVRKIISGELRGQSAFRLKVLATPAPLPK